MNIKKALCSTVGVLILIICLICSAFSGFAYNIEPTYEIGKKITAENNVDTYFFDESFGSDVAVNAMKLIASVTVKDFNANGGFALKFIINNNTTSNDFYFLTMDTNSWAYTDTNNPIEVKSKGTYTLEFDLSNLGQVFIIQGDLWQGTMILNGLQLVDEDNKELATYGSMIEPTVGYYKAGEGKIKNPTPVQTTTTTQIASEITTSATESNTSINVITTSYEKDNSDSGFSFFSFFNILGFKWIAIIVLSVGVILVALAIVFTIKMK